MKFSTAKEHRDFFQKNGWIEFEEFVSIDQLNSVNQAIDQVLATRLNVAQARLHTFSSEKFFLEGHDLWRADPILQKLAIHTRFPEIIAELIEKKPLRLGYDQFFPARQQKAFPHQSSRVFSHFLEQTLSLQTVSCLQGVACGIMISLGGISPLPEEKTLVEGVDIFPSKPGNVIFFQPNMPIRWDHLYEHLGQKFYMIVYTLAHAHYQLVPQDPHTHALKRLGYIFNDKLSDKLNPIIYR